MRAAHQSTTLRTASFGILFALSVFLPSQAHAASLVRAATALGLTGYWPLNEGSGSQAGDFSGNGHTATLTGGTWSSGRLGGDVLFNGTSDKISGSSMTVGTSFTISAWVKKNSSTGQKSFFSNRGTGGRVYAGINGTRVFLFDSLATVPSVNSNTGDVAMGVWQHITITNDGVTTTMYVNGVQVYQTAQGRTSSTGSTFGIGWDPSIGSEYWDGSIDDVRVYSRPLSASEVYALYQAGSITRTVVNGSGLVGWWKFDDGTGIQATDFSGQKTTGTLSGTSIPTWTNGHFGNALSFNGSSSYVTAGTSDTYNITSSLTVVAWVNTSHDFSVDTNKMFAAVSRMQTASPYHGYEIGIGGNYLSATDKAYFHVGGTYASNALIGTTNINDGHWHVLVGTYNGTTATLYVDGVQQGSGTRTNNLSLSGEPLDMGVNYDRTVFFPGSIDDVRIYNRTLSAAEVATLSHESATQYQTPASVLTRGTTLANGLTGYWSFDGTDFSDTTVFDQAGSNNATMTSSLTKVIGKLGQALSFPGSTAQYVQAGGQAGLGTSNQTYTLSAWIRPTTASETGDILHLSSLATGSGWCISPMEVSSGHARATSYNGGLITATGSVTLLPGEWYHLVTTWSAANGLRIYVNGVLDNSTTQSAYTASGASNYLTIGSPSSGTGCNGDTGAAFAGSIDDVRVYSRELSSSEVKQLYLVGN